MPDVLKRIAFQCTVAHVSDVNLSPTPETSRARDVPPPSVRGVARTHSRALSTESFFSPRKFNVKVAQRYTSPGGTEWIHRRVIELVKKKAKEEMALLEQELLAVIQAMEQSTLGENMALALAQGAVTPQDLEGFQQGIVEHERSVVQASLQPQQLYHTPQETPTAFTEPVSQEDAKLSSQSPSSELAAISLELPANGSAREMMHETCSTTGNMQPEQCTRERFDTAAESFVEGRVYSAADARQEDETPVENTEWHSIGPELGTEVREQPCHTRLGQLETESPTQLSEDSSSRLISLMV